MNAKLIMYTNNGRRKAFALSKTVTVVGRADDCDLSIPFASVSRHHCRLTVSGEGSVGVEDLGSSNGTYVNSKLVESQQLQAGDRLTIGPVIFTLKLNGLPSETPGSQSPEHDRAAAAEDREAEGFDLDAAMAEDALKRAPAQQVDKAAPDSASEADPLADLEAGGEGESSVGEEGPETAS